MNIFFKEHNLTINEVKEDFIQHRYVHLIQDLKEFDIKNIEHFAFVRIFQLFLTQDAFLSQKYVVNKDIDKRIIFHLKKLRSDIEDLYYHEVNTSYECWVNQREKFEKLVLNFLDSTKSLISESYDNNINIMIKKKIDKTCYQEYLNISKIFATISVDKNSWEQKDLISLLISKRSMNEKLFKDEEKRISIGTIDVLESIIFLINNIEYFKDEFVDKSIEKYIHERSVLFYNFNPKESNKNYFFERKGIIIENEMNLIFDFKKIHKSFQDKGNYANLHFLKSIFVNFDMLIDIEDKLNRLDNNDIFHNAKEITREIYLVNEVKKNNIVKDTKIKKKI